MCHLSILQSTNCDGTSVQFLPKFANAIKLATILMVFSLFADLIRGNRIVSWPWQLVTPAIPVYDENGRRIDLWQLKTIP